MWDGVAPGWEQQADFVDEHSAAATDVLLNALALRPGQEILELACGPGGAGIAAARRAPSDARVPMTSHVGGGGVFVPGNHRPSRQTPTP